MRFYSHGKILLSGEYTVLHGAQALALPTQKGQDLIVHASEKKSLDWISRNADGTPWFEASFELETLTIRSANHLPTAVRLEQMLQQIRKLQPLFCQTGTLVTTNLEFNREWGLGSSATLVANLGKWSGVDPFLLLDKTLGGSGYDIACAQASGPIFFQRIAGTPKYQNVSFDPPFREKLFFVYLNKKQDSQREVADYMKITPQHELLEKISTLSQQLSLCVQLDTFMSLLKEHEALMATHLKKPTVQEDQFQDFPGVIKSLGAWGGDFVLACGDDPHYFKDKGFPIVIAYDEFIL